MFLSEAFHYLAAYPGDLFVYHEGRVAFIELLAVGKQRGQMLHVSFRGKEHACALVTLQVKSLNLDSSFHRESRSRTSEISMLPPKNLGPTASWEKLNSTHKASFADYFLIIFSKLLSYVFSKIII